MSVTREHRNAGRVDDAMAAIGIAITNAQTLVEILSGNLPDTTDYADAPDYEGEVLTALAQMRQLLDGLNERLGV